MYRLLDTSFAHHGSTCSVGDVSHHLPYHGQFWQRPRSDKHKRKPHIPLVVTHDIGTHLQEPFICWLLEPAVILPELYDNLLCQEPLSPYLRAVWTHDRAFMRIWKLRHPFCPIRWVPNAMTMIHPPERTLGLELAARTGQVCAIFSHKRQVPLHRLRHRLMATLDSSSWIVYGTMPGALPVPQENKARVLVNYRFCVVVENTHAPGYFSEKLLDCFLTGCIPVFYGTVAQLQPYFDTNGVIFWETITDLQRLLYTLEVTPLLVRSRRHNFLKARRYCSVECWLQHTIRAGVPQYD
jgi:hypothetical protein